MKKLSPRYSASIVALSLLVMLIALSWQTIRERRTEILAEHKLAATIGLHAKHDHVNDLLRDFLSIVKSLSAFAQLNPDFDNDDFQVFTHALDMPASVRSVQLQPDGVIRHLTNREENAEAVNLDLLSHPILGPAAWETIRTGKPHLVGPFGLVQGAQGFVLRQPVFIDGYEGAVGVPGFWGFASAVFYADIVLGEAGLDGMTDPDAPGIYALRRVDENGRPGALIYGTDQVFENAVETTSISLPHIELELAVALKPEYSAAGLPLIPPEMRSTFFLQFTLSVVLSMLTWFLIRRLRLHEALSAQYEAQKSANRLKSDFIATMSHEMRTPLNGVLGAMELLERTPLTDEQHHLLRVGQSSGRLLLRHVNSVLDIERLESGLAQVENRPVDIEELLGDVADLITPVAGLNRTVVQRETDLTANRLLGDKDKLRQVLLNFAGNAAKFTKGGRILISARTVGSDGLKDSIEFRVSDTGVGITAKNLAHVFDDFVTIETSYDRETTGSGLGLAICRRIATVLGGQVGAQSEPGKGSTFWMRVPLQILRESDAAEAAEEPRNDAEIAAALAALDLRASLDILLVDDNTTNRLVEGGLLRAAGHLITEARNGREALEIVQGRRFDLILMDISMPQLDGVQATRIIREGTGPNRNTPIIAVTAHAMPAERRRFLEAGMQASMIKPFRISDFENVLEEARKGSRAARLPGPADADREEGADIDWSVLDNLAETLSPEQLTSTLVKVCAEIEREVPLITDRTRHSPRETGERAHKLAGTAALAGAVQLTNGLRTVATAARYEQEEGLAAALATLPASAALACRQIRSRYGLPRLH